MAARKEAERLEAERLEAEKVQSEQDSISEILSRLGFSIQLNLPHFSSCLATIKLYS